MFAASCNSAKTNFHFLSIPRRGRAALLSANLRNVESNAIPYASPYFATFSPLSPATAARVAFKAPAGTPGQSPSRLQHKQSSSAALYARLTIISSSSHSTSRFPPSHLPLYPLHFSFPPPLPPLLSFSTLLPYLPPSLSSPHSRPTWFLPASPSLRLALCCSKSYPIADRAPWFDLLDWRPT